MGSWLEWHPPTFDRRRVTWNMRSGTTADALQSVAFADANRAVAVGEKGTITTSDDSGKTTGLTLRWTLGTAFGTYLSSLTRKAGRWRRWTYPSHNRCRSDVGTANQRMVVYPQCPPFHQSTERLDRWRFGNCAAYNRRWRNVGTTSTTLLSRND